MPRKTPGVRSGGDGPPPRFNEAAARCRGKPKAIDSGPGSPAWLQ